MATQVGVDVGGTFTDLILYDEETKEVTVGKGPSTPSSPDDGVVNVVQRVVSDEMLGRADYFLHGTTVGINALLERKGAKVGVLTTEGFEDVLEIRRASRTALYDMQWNPPQPLAPRRLRFGVSERTLSDGTVESYFSESDVKDALEAFRSEGVECIAIVFINSHANPSHELEAERVLRDAGFDGDISLSHQVTGVYGEFERSSTTTIDAYVRPRVATYLRRLEESLRSRGFPGSCLVTRSGGGAMTFDEAGDRPFETVMSGPVAGAVGSGFLSQDLGFSRAITADVGGTSFDTCLIADGRPLVKYEGEVGEMPLQTPWVNVRSIGAGGGSLAYVDAGLLRVGPQSAGAEPGPVCYGRGGTQPTVTDAAAVLGMLAFGELAGDVTLDFDGARAAVEKLGDELDLEVDAAAQGILTIANAAMAGAIRSVTVELGEDPREAALMAFGGAGPLFGCLLARELDVETIIVPNHAGNFSAWSLLFQDITRSAARTMLGNLDEEGLESANEIADSLFKQLAKRTGKGAGEGEDLLEPALDLRYQGQEHNLTIQPEADEEGRIVELTDDLAERFGAEHERMYGHRVAAPVEIVAVRATARRELRRSVESGGVANVSSDAPVEERSIDAYSFDLGERTDFAVVDRSTLGVGTRRAGPLIVVEPTTTTYVDAGFELEIHDTGTMLIHDRKAS